MRLTILEKHLAASASRPAECWPYPGCINSTTGYGAATLHGRRGDAHRLAYVFLVGPIAAGLEIDHLCRNRACCNPAHLEPVAHRVNLLRGESPSALQARQTHCIHGHELSGDNLYLDRRQRRHCVECRRVRCIRAYYESIEQPDRVVPPRRDTSTHCVNGHPWASNLRRNRHGHRWCRACQSAAVARWRTSRRSP